MPRPRGANYPPNHLIKFLLLSTIATTGYCSSEPQIFNEAPSVTQRRQQSTPRSCWIGREVSTMAYDQSLNNGVKSNSPERPLLTVCPSLRVKCYGRVASWRITLTVADRQPINFAIFRSINDALGERFTMVGYNTFSATTLGRVTFDVPESKQLAVEPGDIFGYFRMGSVQQTEFIGYVNVNMTMVENQQPIVRGTYDSCYQLPMTYIDLIKANYKVTVDSNAIHLRRLYSLAAVVTAEKTGDSSAEKMTTSESSHELGGRRTPTRRLMKSANNDVIFDMPPPMPVNPARLVRTTPGYEYEYEGETDQQSTRKPVRRADSSERRSLPTFLQPFRNRVRTTNYNTSSRLPMVPRQADQDSEDRGLMWCGQPPSIENAYSVNEIIPQIRLPTRSYACQSGYTPVGYNRVYCDPNNRQWTPINFQCIFTIIMEDPPGPRPDQMRTVMVTMPPTGSPPEISPNTCLFPPVIDNGYAIRQDDITVVYRCYPGFLKVGQVDQDGSTCDRATNVWTPPMVSCVIGRNTLTIPLNFPTQAPLFFPPPPNREIPIFPNIVVPTPAPVQRPQFQPFAATVTIPLEIGTTPPAPPQVQVIFPFATAAPPQLAQTQSPMSSSPKDCGLPPRIANGRYYLDPDPYYSAKSYIYECYPGYVMRGQPVVFCNPYFGRFTQLTARCDPASLDLTTSSTAPYPTRQPIPANDQSDCGTPPPLSNAFTVTGGRRSSAVYLCLPGYTGVGIAEIQCMMPAPDDDPGRGPTWSRTSFQCNPSTEVQTLPPPAPVWTTQQPPSQQETPADPNSVFQPFLIIPGTRRTSTNSPVTTTPVAEVTKTEPWPQMPAGLNQFPIIFPNRVPPFLLPGNSVQLVTPPASSLFNSMFRPQQPSSGQTAWGNVETLQPTMRPFFGMIDQNPPATVTPSPMATEEVTNPRTTVDWMTPASGNGQGESGACQVFQTCGEPPQVDKAKMEPSYNGRHSCPGDYVRYVCEPGFRLDSLISAVFCSQASYSWSPNRPPTCVLNSL